MYSTVAAGEGDDREVFDPRSISCLCLLFAGWIYCRREAVSLDASSSSRNTDK